MKKVLLIIALFLMLIKSGYSAGPVAGMTLGTPGLLNVNAGYYGETLGISFSFSFLHLLEAWANEGTENTSSEIRENTGLFYALFQLNLDWKFIDNGNLVLAGSVAGGTICFSDKQVPENDLTVFYAGPCIHFIWNGFFTELGAAYGRNLSAKYEEKKTHIVPLIQIGYLIKY